MIITLRISISFRPIVRCTAVSSSHSPSGVAFSLVFEFGDLRLNPRVVCCADTAPQPFYLSLALPSFLPTSPGVLPSPARSRGWRGRGCRRQRQHGLPHGAADVFEINIDPVRAGSCELFGKVGCTMIDIRIEAKFFDDGAAFLRAAGNAARSRARELGELPNQ